MLVVDLECSGLDAGRHGIISLGAVDFLNPVRTLYLECRLRPGAEFDEEAFAVHGLSQAYLAKLPLTEEQLLKQFFAWAAESPSRVLMGQVPQMDWEFLKAGAERYGIEWVFGHRSIDLHSVCVAHHYFNNVELAYKYGFPALSLDNISKYVGLPARPGNHHALDDSKITAECFARLLLKKNLLPEYEKFSLPKLNMKFGVMH